MLISSFPFTALSSSCSGISVCGACSSAATGFEFSGELFRFLVSISGAPIVLEVLLVLETPSWTAPDEKKDLGFKIS